MALPSEAAAAAMATAAGMTGVAAPPHRPPLPPDLVIKSLDDENELLLLDAIQHMSWAPALSTEQFLEREKRLSLTNFAKERRLTWVLLHKEGDKSLPEDGVEDCAATPVIAAKNVLASLETYRQDAVGPSGERCNVYGIASVFTPEQHRGKGYASALCSGIQQKLRDMDATAVATVLYSDVGASLYERASFRLPPSTPTDAYFRLRCDTSSAEHVRGGSADEAAAIAAAEVAASTTEALSRSQVAYYVESSAAQVARDRVDGRLVVLPTADQVDWILEREYCCCAQLGTQPLPQAGARRGDSFAVWSMDVSKHKRFLKVLLFNGGSSQADAAAVAAAAVVTARNAGAYEGGVVSWGAQGAAGDWPLDASALHAAGVRVDEIPRSTSLPMLAALRGNVNATMWKYVPRAIWL